MKSVALLGLGVVALTAGAFITAGAAGSEDVSSVVRGSYFEAAVDGGVSARPSGEVVYGVAGDTASGVASFSITLDGDSSGAVILTSLEGRMPAPGRYPLSEGAGSEGFRASYIAGTPLRPSGLFRAQRGTLEITTSTPERLGGHFTFTAAGFHAADPSDEGSEVTVTGAFMSTRPASLARAAQP